MGCKSSIEKQSEPLRHAVAEKQHGEIRRIIQEPVSEGQLSSFLNVVDSPGGRTCLHLAANQDDLQSVELLLEPSGKGGARLADTTIVDQKGWTAFALALHKGHSDVANRLRNEAKPSGSAAATKSCTTRSLMIAVYEENRPEDVCRWLSLDGADVEQKDSDGYTLLQLAAMMSHTEVVTILLDAGADIEAKDEDGSTSLALAATCGHPEVVNILIKRGAKVDDVDNSGLTPLFAASVRGFPEVVTSLVKRGGANVNHKGVKGRTPLHTAVLAGDMQMVCCLLDVGANYNLRDADSYSPLKMATIKKHSDIAAELLNRGAKKTE